MGDQHPGTQPVVVRVNRELLIPQSEEPGVAIPAPTYNRLMERVEALRLRGLEDVWLHIAGLGGGLAFTAPFAGTREVFWLVFLGVSVWLLSLGAYLTQRRSQYKDVTELKKDMEIYKTDRGS